MLPLLSLANGTDERDRLELTDILFRWTTVTIYLLSLWFSNIYIDKKPTKLNPRLKKILWNLAFIATFLFLIIYSLPTSEVNADVPNGLVLLRLSIVSGFVVIVQYTLKASNDNAKLKTENLELQAEYYKAQLDQLRKQVNPHFLFNSLSTLRTMIREPKNSEKSEQFVLSLSDVYRQLLQTRESDSISLKEELKFLESFLYLLQIRFGESLTIQINVDETSKGYSIPAFSLQLLVENCIKHNVASFDNPLKVEIFQDSPEKISVRNNFNPKHHSDTSLGTGLNNLIKRYELIGIEEGVIIDKTENYYLVELKLF